MYTIIGGDGREYGPVTADQVKAWLAGGRANLETKVKAAGTEEWKRVADFPEITGVGAVPGSAVAAALAQLPAVARDLDILSCYERSWALLRANFLPLVGISILMGIIWSALSYTLFVGIFYVVPLFSGVLAGGMFNFFLLTVRGQPATIGDAFAGFTKAFGALFVAGLLVYVFRTVGFVLLILPGIYLTVAYTFTFLLPIDKGLGFWEAMETSRTTITRQWWRVFGLLLLAIPIMLLGALALGVGIFVAIPLIVGAITYAYEDLCNPKK